jgi:cyclic pyranopterin monophosphate synthase
VARVLAAGHGRSFYHRRRPVPCLPRAGLAGARRARQVRGVTLYDFDDVGSDLELLPLAARRALDVAGRRLSRAGWRSLSLEARRALIQAGSEPRVDVAEIERLVAPAVPSADVVEPAPEPSADGVPASVVAALGPDRPLPASVWAALAPLDRYALANVCARGRAERIEAAYAEIVGHSAVSSHLGPGGGARMVGIGEKAITARRAVAEAIVTLGPDALDRLRRHAVPKGDVLGTARIAGILAAKRTPELIPLCHHVQLTRVVVDFEILADVSAVRILASAEAADRTGVEMESLVAASVAALTLYDMLKGVDRGITIGPTRLLEKTGGRTGEYRR